MKNKLVTLFLAVVFVFSLSISSIADGNIGHGGRACGGVDQPPCEPTPTPLANEQPSDEDTFIKDLLDYLSQIFE